MSKADANVVSHKSPVSKGFRKEAKKDLMPHRSVSENVKQVATVLVFELQDWFDMHFVVLAVEAV